MKLVFGDQKCIDEIKEKERLYKLREKRFLASGLTRGQFEAREELNYWLYPNIAPSNRGF